MMIISIDYNEIKKNEEPKKIEELQGRIFDFSCFRYSDFFFFF